MNDHPQNKRQWQSPVLVDLNSFEISTEGRVRFPTTGKIYLQNELVNSSHLYGSISVYTVYGPTT